MNIQGLIEKVATKPESVTTVVFSRLELKDDDRITELLQALLNKCHNTIQHISLSDYTLNSEHVRLVGELLTRSSTLKYLYLNNTGLNGQESARDPASKTNLSDLMGLFEKLGENRTLLKLELEQTDFSYLGLEMIERVNTLIKEHQTLFDVYLDQLNEERFIAPETWDILRGKREEYFKHREKIEVEELLGNIRTYLRDLNVIFSAIPEATALIQPQNVVPYKAFMRLVGALGDHLIYFRYEDEASMHELTKSLVERQPSIVNTVVSMKNYFAHDHIYRCREDSANDNIQIQTHYDCLKNICRDHLNEGKLDEIDRDFPRRYLERRKNVWTSRQLPTAQEILEGLRQSCKFVKMESTDFMELMRDLSMPLIQNEIEGTQTAIADRVKELSQLEILALEESVKRICQLVKDRDRHILVTIRNINQDFSKFLEANVVEQLQILSEETQKVMIALKKDRDVLSHCGLGYISEKPALISGLILACQKEYFLNIEKNIVEKLEGYGEKFDIAYEQYKQRLEVEQCMLAESASVKTEDHKRSLSPSAPSGRR